MVYSPLTVHAAENAESAVNRDPRLAAGMVVDMAFVSARGAPPSPFPADMGVYDKRRPALRILAEAKSVDGRPLDMEEILQQAIGSRPMSLFDNGVQATPSLGTG